jgi:tetratricopeptide (TPR) repeat protein
VHDFTRAPCSAFAFLCKYCDGMRWQKDWSRRPDPRKEGNDQRNNLKKWLVWEGGIVPAWITNPRQRGICPDWYEPYFTRGYIRIAFLFDFTGAIDDFFRVIELNPDNPDAYFNRGEAKYKLQDYVGARSDYNAAVAIKPNVGTYYGNDDVA